MGFLATSTDTLPTLSSLRQARGHYRLAKLLFSCTWVIAIGLTLLVLFVTAKHHLVPDIPDELGEVATGGLVCGFAFIVGAPLYEAHRRCRLSLENLFAKSDLRMTPILFEFLLDTFESEGLAFSKRELEDFRVPIRAALMRLLPQIGQEHASLFPSRTRALWRRFLNRAPSSVADTKLAILVLKMLEVLGDEQDLEVVARIADGRSPRSWPLKQAACACIATTGARLKQEQARASLLRPADQGDLLGQTLLRPHQNGAASSPEQLLRPSHSS